MKIGIVDVAYKGNGAFFRGTSAAWLDWECKQHGGDVVAIGDADAILFTASDPREHEEIRRAIKRWNVRRTGIHAQFVFVGGGIGTSPAILDNVADAVCVGEGRNFVRALCREGPRAAMALPNAWVPGESREVIPDADFPWDAPPVVSPDSGSANVYLSRGCAKKCLFCQTGWAGPYTENPLPIVGVEQMLRREKIPIAYVSNDVGAVVHREATEATAISVTYDALSDRRYNGQPVPPNVRTVRIGVEAGSERLRRLIGKPIPSAGLAAMTSELMNRGVDVRWFLVAGLPGETDADWVDLREMTFSVKRTTTRNRLELSFTAFLPAPAAPLCIAPLTDDYWGRFEAFNKWFFETKAFSRRIRILRPCGPQSRMRYSLAAMAASESDLRRGWFDRDPPNWRVKYPWRDRMRKAFDVYWRKVNEP